MKGWNPGMALFMSVKKLLDNITYYIYHYKKSKISNVI